MSGKPDGPDNSYEGGAFFAVIIIAFLLLVVSRCGGGDGEPDEDLSGSVNYSSRR